MYHIKIDLSKLAGISSVSPDRRDLSFVSPDRRDLSSVSPDRRDLSEPIKPVAILSPCIGICALDASGLCEGCLRTSAEIGAWSTLSDHQRAHIMDVVLPAREKA
jgi:uncharacterized protein